MKARRFLGALPFIIVVAMPACSDSDFVQSECPVTNNDVEIWLVDRSSDEQDPPHRSFSFQPKAIAMRVRPMYYAVEWKDVKKILFQRGPGDSHGLMTIEVREGNGSYVEKVGKVDSECEVELARFLREKNIPMVITETSSQRG